MLCEVNNFKSVAQIATIQEPNLLLQRRSDGTFVRRADLRSSAANDESSIGFIIHNLPGEDLGSSEDADKSVNRHGCLAQPSG